MATQDNIDILDTIIVGSGFSGLCLALHLRQAGYRWRLLEKAANLGGTWRDNHYPGAACDIPSNLYSLSFMPNPDWSRLYPPQAEIEAYLNRCADQGGLRSDMEFNAHVISAVWNQSGLYWQVTLDDGRSYLGRTLALGTGGLSRPEMPKVPGLESFQGDLFHSARWRHDVALEGKRVGVIGTGASAIQIVPAIAPTCGQLSLFQRTAAWIVPRNDQQISEQTRALYRRHPWRQKLNRQLIYWQLESRMLAFSRARWILKLLRLTLIKQVRARLRNTDLSEKLTPSYTPGCKRILLSDDFYRTFKRDNVTLVNHGVVEVTPTGVVTADGEKHALDVLIAATGFQVADAGAPFDVLGTDGLSLNQVWGTTPQAYLGTVVAGFPNLFVMTGPNTGLGHNSMVYVIESQARFVMLALAALQQKAVGAFDVKLPVQQAYNQQLQKKLRHTVWNDGGCRSWYLAPDGSNRVLWPDFTFLLRKRLGYFDPVCFHLIEKDKS